MADFADNILSGFSQGVGLAQHIQAVQAQREQIETERQVQFVKKTNYIAKKIRDGLLLPKPVQNAYFKQVRAQAEQLQIPYDESSEAMFRSDDFRTQALSGLNSLIGLPDDQKTQAGEMLFAFIGGDVTGLSKHLLAIKDSQTKASLAVASQQNKQNSQEMKQANLGDKVVREVTNYGPAKLLEQNIQAGQAALANIAKDPSHVLFRDYKEAVIEINKMLTNSSVLPIGREEGLEFKSGAVKAQQYIDKLAGGSESDFIDPKEAKLTIDRLSRLVTKAQTGRDSMIKKQLDARVVAGVIPKHLSEALYTTMAAGAAAPEVTTPPPPKLNETQKKILNNAGIKPGTPEFDMYAKALAGKAGGNAQAQGAISASSPPATPEPSPADSGVAQSEPSAPAPDAAPATPEAPSDASGQPLDIEEIPPGETQ